MKKMLPLLVTLLVTQQAIAHDPKQPASCPTVAALASVGVDLAVQYQELWFATHTKHDYGTPESWSFTVLTPLHIDDVTGEQAVAEVNGLVATMLSAGEPKYSQADAAWACFYATADYEYVGIAMTPPTAIPVQMAAIKKLAANL